ncbi:4-(cytidine 5'-diphospho)-2-C-methyl-D-erythritol kinase [Thalassococcus sp. S3]|uniref:4-(cytidine 5'-diphospho)-2-C-methyl-D-erythritol kinase n=1 Tax=Thalassococcus sp. S3 TaxID=2017482 RepID=UPI00102421B5|nr:4-(cytidine 5'-diphospho)-2-C-methyl-D-erythritol kinase [Thalassococcus sp. S3]QBF30407.1 4-(cytidine 5'-diphospho)-2-C-methyl-D-erythritol kinase [Thalassococcus sp. S3]
MQPNKARRAHVFAPAKINLTLHVTGQRADGYHMLDSLVVFADVGDDLVVTEGQAGRLNVNGPEAGDLSMTADNLILKAADWLGVAAPLSFTLTKNLPVASGIGGGSADAAAAYRALSALDVVPGTKRDAAETEMLALGADIPVCIASDSARMGGIGERIEPVQNLPDLTAMLVNPRKHVATPAIFRALRRKDNAPMSPELPFFQHAQDLVAWLHAQRNDLEAPAVELEPSIDQVLSSLRSLPGCQLARMSGSGATCFAVFADTATTEETARQLRDARPDWWIRTARFGSMTEKAAPVVR